MPFSFLGSSGSGGSSVPFTRITDPSKLGIYLNLEEAELLRIQRYDEAWRFYYGDHWSFSREDGEPLVTINYYRKFIDKHAEFIASKGFTTTSPEALEEVTRPYIEEVWKYNNKETKLWDMAIMGGVTGDIFVLVTESEPTEIQKKVFPFSAGKTRILLLGSEQVFPTWDPIDVDTLTSARIHTLFYEDESKTQIDSGNIGSDTGRQLKIKHYVQIITNEQIVEYFQGEPPSVRPNTLGEIPLVHIKNLNVPKEFYGMPDGQDLLDLNRELNEKSTDISDTINYHAAPITVITGAKAKSLSRGPRQIWSGLPEKASVFNLELEGELSAAENYWDRIKKAMHEIGDVPEGILGETQPISNTSGVALHIQYQPIIGRARRKRSTYGLGIKNINYFILRIGAIQGRINLPFDCCENCGGRIIEVPTGETVPVWDDSSETYIDINQTKKKCYEINKQTLDFEDPKNIKIKILREYGFGQEIREVEKEEADKIARGERSYWDYAKVNLKDFEAWKEEVRKINEENAKRSLEKKPSNLLKADGSPAEIPFEPIPPPPPPVPEVTPLPAGDVVVPEEPETILFRTDLRHPSTGEVVRVIEKEKLLVPTGCKKPKYLNPFETEVTFGEPLPKDEALQTDLYERYQRNEWVDVQWVQEHLPEVKGDMEDINRRVKSRKTSGLPAAPGAALIPGASAASSVTDLTPATQDIAAVPGPGGNPTTPPNDGRG